VVVAEPDLGHVGELVVGGDLPHGYVAVVVVDRLRAGVYAVELAGRRRVQQEVVVDEWLHNSKAKKSGPRGPVGFADSLFIVGLVGSDYTL
jgi:hypothetical protein